MMKEGLIVRWGEAKPRLCEMKRYKKNFVSPFRKTNLHKPRLVFTYCNFKEEEEGK